MKKIFKAIFIIIAAVVLVNMASLAYRTVMHIIYPVRYFEYISRYSAENDLDEYLVMAVIKAESNYIHDAHSGVARGLMQLTEDTAVWISEKLGMEFEADDVENPEKNIKMGCYYLKYLIDHYNGNIDVALAAYNAGMGNVSGWLKDKRYSQDGETLYDIPYDETKNYVKKVGEYYKTYKKLYRLDENLSAKIQ